VATRLPQLFFLSFRTATATNRSRSLDPIPVATPDELEAPAIVPGAFQTRQCFICVSTASVNSQLRISEGVKWASSGVRKIGRP
jgi:hypothetical protein